MNHSKYFELKQQQKNIREFFKMGYKQQFWSQFARQNLTILILIILPFNFLYRLYLAILRHPFIAPKFGSEDTHRKKRERVQAQVRAWGRGSRAKKMCTGRPKTHSAMYRLPKYRDTLTPIDVGDLTQIINIDPERKIIKVEPGVTMGDLTEILIPLGWTIPVVPELEFLTVGGLIMGGGIQASSHNYGLFHRTCISYEMVMSSGEVIVCSEEENSDLFRAIPCSFGTLGFLTAVKIQLIEAKKYVQLEYHPVHTFKDGLALFDEFANQGHANEFVDAVVFTKNKWVIMTGNMTDVVPASKKINKIRSWYAPWFFKQVQEKLTTGKDVDFIPLKDYYHRHTPCTFWLASTALPSGNCAIFRYLFGWVLPINMSFFKAALPSGAVTEMLIIQDYLVPRQAVSQIIDEIERQTGMYPLWLCPFYSGPKTEVLWNFSRGSDGIYYEIGLYGLSTNPNLNIKQATKKMEQEALKYKGGKGFYTDTYMTENEIRDVCDLTLYENVRKRHQAEDAFPHFVTKVSIKARVEGL